MISTVPSNMIDIRKGKSAAGSVTCSSAGQGSATTVWAANIDASWSSSASWKQISPYSGSAGIRSSADEIATARHPLASITVAFTTSPRCM